MKSEKVTVDRRALWDVLAYLWTDEKADYESAAQHDKLIHIYRSLKKLADQTQAPMDEWEWGVDP